MRPTKALVILIAAAAALAPMPASLVERWYSAAWYPALQPRLTAFSNLFPNALFDLFCVILAAALLGFWWRGLVRAPKGSRWRAAPRLAIDTLAAIAVVYLWFLAAWGMNYRREKIAVRLDFDETRITRTALVAIASQAAVRATSVRELARPSADDAPLEVNLAAPFSDVLRMLGAPVAHPSRPKWSVLALLWPRVGVDGMTDPFFLESLVRTDVLPFERPVILAHEWAHLAGFADESEASFIAYLTCVRGNPDARYSGWLMMYAQVAGDLRGGDRLEVERRLGPGPLADLRALAEKTRREIAPFAWRANTAVYDRFLKANRLESGVRSYDEVTRLLAGTRMTEDWRPVLRP
jgi:uncharacterized protein DUF3810